MPLKTTPWDSAELLREDKDIAYFLEAALDDYDPAHFAHALGIVARSKGMTKVAKAAGLSREGLYKSLSKGKTPSFDTVFRVMRAVGLCVSVKKPVRRRPAPKPAKLAA